VKIAALNQCK